MTYISPNLPDMIRNLWRDDPSENSARTILALAGDLIQELIDLRQTVTQVHELHAPEPYFDEPTISFCRECQSCGSHGTYPCPTIQTLEGTEETNQ